MYHLALLTVAAQVDCPVPPEDAANELKDTVVVLLTVATVPISGLQYSATVPGPVVLPSAHPMTSILPISAEVKAPDAEVKVPLPELHEPSAVRVTLLYV